EGDGLLVERGSELSGGNRLPVCAVIAAIQFVFANVTLVFALVLARHQEQATHGDGLCEGDANFVRAFRAVTTGIGAGPGRVRVAIHNFVRATSVSGGSRAERAHDA